MGPAGRTPQGDVRHVVDAGCAPRFDEPNVVDGVDGAAFALEHHAVRWFETRDRVVHFGRAQPGFDDDPKAAADGQRPRCQLFRLGHPGVPLFDQAEIGGVAKRFRAAPGYLNHFVQSFHIRRAISFLIHSKIV
jgi:hypothetical protein